LYFSTFQSVDEEEFGGAWELTKEGFMTSFAGFLVRNRMNSASAREETNMSLRKHTKKHFQSNQSLQLWLPNFSII
jgi:hypothetical protein